MAYRDDLRALVAIRPAPGRWRVALQAALAIGVPAVGFALAGRADLGLLASTGAFTALHLAARSRFERVRWLPVVGAGLLASTAAGVLASASVVASVVTVFVIAVVASVIALGRSLGPPGSMFFVLTAGVAARLAGPASLGGAALPGGLIIGMVAVGVVCSYLVVVVPLLVPSVRRFNADLDARQQRRRFDLDPVTRLILVRIAIAAAIGAIVAAPLGVHRVYWVIVTIVVILQNGHARRLGAIRAVQRMVGTLIGVGVFALVLLWDPRDLVLAFVLVALQFVVEMLVVRNYGLALLLITPLALLIAAQGASADIAQTATERVLDTLIGGAIALAVLLVSWAVRRRAKA